MKTEGLLYAISRYDVRGFLIEPASVDPYLQRAAIRGGPNAQLALGPSRVMNYVAGRPDARDEAGHSPTGAWAVLAMLLVLAAQVLSGLMSDDEIAFAGPLSRFVSGAVVGQATYYHAHIGQYVLLGLIGLHIAAIAFYIWRLKKTVLRPMLDGDKQLSAPQPRASQDTAGTRLVALLLLALCAGLMWWVSRL